MVMDEFVEFIARHRGRHPFVRLPEFAEADKMYRAWFQVLMVRRITDVAALDTASNRLLIEPARTHADHFPTLARYAAEAMKALGGGPKHDLSTREGAEAASQNCERGCGGTGLTTVYHPAPDPAKRIAPTSAAYCVCAAGRWIERNHRERSPDVRKRIPDLADVIAGQSEWLTDDPTARQCNEYGDF